MNNPFSIRAHRHSWVQRGTSTAARGVARRVGSMASLALATRSTTSEPEQVQTPNLVTPPTKRVFQSKLRYTQAISHEVLEILPVYNSVARFGW